MLEDEKLTQLGSGGNFEEKGNGKETAVAVSVAEKMARKRSERSSYFVAAVMSSFGVTSMAVMAVYYRFAWQMEVLIHFSASLSLSLMISITW